MLVQIVVNGLVLAGTYALVAVGLTLVFGVMRMVNFAEGQSVMIGAFVAFTAAPYIGYVPAILVAMLVNAGFGIILERTAFRPFRGVELNGLIASMGMSIILINAGELIWGTAPQQFDTALNDVSFRIGTIGVSGQRLLVIGSSVVLLTLLWWVVQRSALGRQFRAVSEDPEIAAAMGIDPHRISRLSVMLGSALAAAAGALTGPVNLMTPRYGADRDAKRLRGHHPRRVRQCEWHHSGRAADWHGAERLGGLRVERLFRFHRVRPADCHPCLLPARPGCGTVGRECLAPCSGTAAF
ncbi:MAG: branched-chain amino acid ABC transporter permease [Acetobacteraceae bacterium]